MTEQSNTNLNPRLIEDDSLFLNLLEGIEKNLTEFDTTLTINGIILTGTLISVQTYYLEIGQMMVSTLSPVEKEKSMEVYKKSGELERQFILTAIKDETPRHKVLKNFHVRNAQFVQNRLLTPNSGLLWRGRVSEIDGYGLTKLV
jgi:hypothetical protein